MKPQRFHQKNPQADARHYALRLTDLTNTLPHVINELHEALIRCGGSVERDVCGVLGQSGLIEQVVQNISAMLDGERKDSLPNFGEEVENALIRSKHDR